ncbi:hypothetical protein [Marinobacter alkaliphilus]|uniref:Uncharacterized protein n=1 Tax=Marinobacter alkaliphilus TaxID=254719 RepID=A0ABZ3E8X5_9GAMM
MTDKSNQNLVRSGCKYGVKAQRPESDMQELIGGKFAAGEGLLVINPELDDAAIANDIRCALVAAKGQPFKVVQAPSSIKD